MLRGRQDNLCRSCSKRIQGGLLVAALEKTSYICPQCGGERTITGSNLTKIQGGVISGRCKSCATKLRLGQNPRRWDDEHKALFTEQFRRPRPNQVGSGNHKWKGGITSWRNCLRGTAAYGQWRRQIFVRDGFRCQLCGEIGLRLEAHHIVLLSTLLEENGITSIDDAIECQSLWDTENGVTMCEDCHTNIHKQSISGGIH